MDVRVEADSIEVSLSVEMGSAIITIIQRDNWTCLVPAISLSLTPVISLGSHSISAIAPDFTTVGGQR